MAKIKKTIGLDKIGIESLSMPEKDKQYFRQLVGQVEQMHREIKEQAEAGGFQTKTWRTKEDGDDLIIQKKVSGTWTDAFTIKGS